MYCPNCGTLNDQGAETCQNCQKPMPRLEPAISNETPPPSPASGEKPRPDFLPGQPGSQYNYTPSAQPGYNYAPGGVASQMQMPYNPAPGGYAPAYAYSYSSDRIGVAQHDAGFWVRLGAWFIDSLIVGLMSLLIIGVPQLVYWSNFATKYSTEIVNNCPDTTRYDVVAEQRCNDTLQSIFIDRNQLGPLLSISIIFSAVALILALVYYVGMTAYGATLGKRVFGLKVVKEDGSPPGFGTALLRQTIGYWISGAVFYLGFIWVAFDDKKQGWHDKIARTFVVRA